jgi:hypothetical protein
VVTGVMIGFVVAIPVEHLKERLPARRGLRPAVRAEAAPEPG